MSGKIFHTDLIKSFTVSVRPDETENERIVRDISDAIANIPPNIENEYIERLNRAAAFLGKIRNSNHEEDSIAMKNYAMALRNDVFEVIENINEAITRMRSDVTSPKMKNNPFSLIASLNDQRKGFLPISLESGQADIIVSDIKMLLARIENDDNVIEENRKFDAAQLSSTRISFDGFGGSGNPAVDILRFSPNTSLLRRQRELDAEAARNFSKRTPSLVFTADYVPDGHVRGSIIGWKRVPDATGYIIKRKNIFEGSEKRFQVTNDELKSSYTHLRDYVKMWILSFYDRISPDTIWSFVDEGIQGHGFFSYSIQAYQVHKPSSANLFDTNVSLVNLSQVQRIELKNSLKTQFGNPYPLLAKEIFGDERHDWILAGTNVMMSISRRDNESDTSKFTYLGSQLDFLFNAMDNGKFFVPKDANSVIKALNDSISHIGVESTLSSVFEQTGIMGLIEGVNTSRDQHFSNVDTFSKNNSQLLLAAFSSLDSSTSILNLKSFITNLQSVMTRIISSNIRPASKSSELEIPDLMSSNELGALLASPNLDMTTLDGFSGLMQAIRVVFDVGASKVPRSASGNTTIMAV